MDIFENIGAKLNQVGSDASKKLKTMQSVSELNSKNAKLKNSVSDLLSKLGMEYYKTHRDDAEAEFAGIIANINELNQQYISNCAEIQRLKAIAVCNACGAEIPRGYSFCPKCGTRLETEAEDNVDSCFQNSAIPTDEIRNAGQRCPRCGGNIRPGAKFCSKCGYNAG